MKLELKQLKLLCRQGEEIVPFSPDLSFFHGEMAAGKSSIPELVNYCLGGGLVYTTALREELVSLELEFSVGDTKILVERNPGVATLIDVTWEGEEQFGRATLPLQAKNDPVIEPDIFNFSDFMVKSLGQPIIKVRKRANDPESELERLSFRDMFRFVYLDQDDLDSSFFKLEQPIRAEKSKNVLRFFSGLWNEKLNELEAWLSNLRQEQRVKREAANQIAAFLQKFGFSSEEGLKTQINEALNEQERLDNSIEKLQSEGISGVSVDEENRLRIAELSGRISSISESISELNERIHEQESLIAEFVSMKFKAARTNAASELLKGAQFHSCPSCGKKVGHKVENEDECYLCKESVSENSSLSSFDIEVIDKDLNDRIDDLKRSVTKMKKSLDTQQRKEREFTEDRSELENKTLHLQKSTESEYIKRIRKYESQSGAVRERVKLLTRVQAMPTEIERIWEEASALSSQIDEIRRKISIEEGKLSEGDANIKRLEENFLSVLLAINFPGVTERDKVEINRKTWAVKILDAGRESAAYSFYDLGSGGKKVLFKISFALALHLTAAQRDLPVPRLLIIDSSMKNIATDVNPEIFEAFYQYLYTLMEGELRDWQVVIVDQTYKTPPDTLDVKERYMTRDDKDHPPLISYYRGA